MNYELHLGDCLETLRAMPDNSVDAIVTDPPYGLSFMGKKWDYDVPTVEVWAECLRVLKPGGHLLAFAGTRTQHRMAVRIEDAGFEIRDMIAWVYGSGFPKSMDVSKAIDKMDAGEEQERRRLAFTAWVRLQGVTSRQIDETTGTNMGGHYTTAASQPAIMTREHLEACRHLFREVPKWVEDEADVRSVESKNFNQREVLSTEIRYNEPSGIVSAGRDERTLIERKITTANTDAARQWQGWGTALKPALEPITVARKPLAGTVAENVMAHGTGALNIDGCRVGIPDGDKGGWRPNCYGKDYEYDNEGQFLAGVANGSIGKKHDAGRWPANLIHDGSEEVLAGFPQAPGQMAKAAEGGDRRKSQNVYGAMTRGSNGAEPRADAGSAARFFYCAKASKSDRGAENVHPTVKPTELMRYLCRLVTPPGGVVMDPFMGSGSTGKAAMLEGFKFIGCELSQEYIAIAEARIKAAIPAPTNAVIAPQMDLLAAE